MTADQLQAWQLRMGYSLAQASKALGVHLSSYARMRNGQSPIDTRTALACAALAAGLAAWGSAPASALDRR